MQKARMLSNGVEYLAKQKNISDEALCDALKCEQTHLRSFFKGRSLLSFDQLKTISNVLGTTVSQLLEGDAEHYEESVVHCMNPFHDTKNRELILDIIDDYLDVLDALSDEAPSVS